jgi:enamine deaminase RidA (YjgF/YER057c/UK114 family)
MVYVADMKQKPEMNRAWDEWAGVQNPPMRACVGAALEGASLVEIVFTAAI